MMQLWHLLGFSRPPGAQILYWIRRSCYEVIGGIGICAASWHQNARDEWIEWSASARAQNLAKVVCNHRFFTDSPGARS